MIRCDVWLCNPPYNGNKNKANCLHVSIAKHIKKKKIERFIQVSPIVAQMKYKTAEYIGNPFGIRWSNIFIFDMLGNENEYFSQNKMPLWDKTSNKCIWLEGEGYNQKVILCDINKNNAKTRYKIKDCKETNDFIDWLNTNEIAKWRLTWIRSTLASPALYNRLWEIYKNES